MLTQCQQVQVRSCEHVKMQRLHLLCVNYIVHKFHDINSKQMEHVSCKILMWRWHEMCMFTCI